MKKYIINNNRAYINLKRNNYKDKKNVNSKMI